MINSSSRSKISQQMKHIENTTQLFSPFLSIYKNKDNVNDSQLQLYMFMKNYDNGNVSIN